MKNKKLCIALAVIIGFTLAACVTPDDPGGEIFDFVAVTHITGLPSYKQVDTDLTLSGKVQPTTATNKTITWSIAADDNTSTGPSLAGNVLKTTAAGTVKVTATVINGASETTDYTQNITITVTAVIPDHIPVADITGILTTTTAGVDLSLSGAVVEPSDATNKTIAWSVASAGTTGATIVSNSTLKTTAAGTATITATVAKGATTTTNYTKTFTITVEPVFVAVTNITGVSATATAGTDLPLSGTVVPSNATNQTITWSIANAGTTGATIANNSTLKTTAAGTAIVTATVVNGASKTANYTKNFTITVTEPPITFIPVTNITGVPPAATAGTDLPLSGTVVPSNATNKTITWSIATTNALNGATVVNGVLKTTAAGTATVTATVVNGASATTNYTKNFTITVTSVTNPGMFNDITAAALVAGIKIGWNLGNTLDAHNLHWLPANPTVSQMETAWSNPVTTKAMITAIKNAGFNGIRIPVSWTKAADSNYNIRADWMNRVVEVVNYAVENDMYIILNSHHDEEVFKFMNSNAAAGKEAFQKIWEQIANTFKNYNEKLIFEGLNEPRTIGSGAEWGGGTNEEHAHINAYYQIFVDTVRASGGNNDKRILQINTYAASAEQSALNGLTLPTDTVQNKLIVSVHIYAPYEFAMNESGTSSWSASNSSDVSGVTAPIDRAYNTFASRGIPVTIGEFGSMHKNNTAARAEWAQFYVSYATNKGLKCFWWDDGGNTNTAGDKTFSLFNRNNNTFYFPEIKEALINGAYDPDSLPPGEGGGGDPTPNTITGNMGNFSFGKQANGIDPNYGQAVWTLTGSNLTTAKQSSAKLVLVLNAAPTASMQLVWQGPANELWWNDKAILNDYGSPINGTGVTWNAGTNTLTINLATALKDYSIFTAQPSLNLIIAYYKTDGNINDLGMVSANVTN